MCFSFDSNCQQQDPALGQKVIPPSPDAQAFMKYGDIPVSHSTGVPNIEIPIYEITSSKLKLPIKLNYHPAIKPADVASVVGLGWKLNAGGLLTRSIKGKADEAPNAGMLNIGYYTKNEIDNSGTAADYYHFFDLQAKGYVDNSSDNYFYSTSNGLSGEFVYNENGQMVKLSYNSHKVIRTAQNTFEVTDDDGTFYQFDKKEETLEDGADWRPSSWWISKMISSDKTDTISFEYETYPYPFSDVFVSQFLEEGFCKHGGVETNKTFYTGKVVLLKKIKFRNGYVDFSYLNDRIDGRESRLKSISIYNYNGLLKKVELDQSYFWSGYANDRYNYRMKLTGMTTKDGSDGTVHAHAFQYNETNILPPYPDHAGSSQFHPEYALDYWSYYNGKIYNPNLIPYLPYNFPSADRNPVEEYAKACVLEKIIYPTGGYTAFTYNANMLGESAGSPGNGQIIGGLRVSTITSTAGPGLKPVKKTYEYANGVSLNPLGNIGKYDYWQMVKVLVDGGSCNYCIDERQTYVSSSIIPFYSFNGNPVIYTSVYEFTEGENNERLKTNYLYDVEEDQYEYISYPRYQDEYSINRNWARGNLLVTSDYKMKNGGYQPVRSVSNSYTPFYSQRVIIGTQLQHKQRNIYSSGTCGDFHYHPSHLAKGYFYYFDEKVDVGIKKIESTTTLDYDDQGNYIATTQNFSYGSSDHLYPTKITSVDSKGHTVETTRNYPHNFSTVSPYNEMVNRNNISPTVEEISTNITLAKEISHKKTNYNFFQSSQLIEPSSIEMSYGGASLQAVITINGYDNRGNVKTVSKENGPKTNYLYSYKGEYPIAKIENAEYSAIESILGGPAIENFKNSSPTTEAEVNNFLAPLRASLPKDALVTSYTYKPLIGMTSMTDPREQKTTYEYDNFQRLWVVRDHTGKILKKYDYHYKP